MPPRRAKAGVGIEAIRVPPPDEVLPDERLAWVPPGPDVLLAPQAEADVEEWISGWLASAELLARSVRPPGPLFLHGPPGTGKTAVTMMIARRFHGSRSTLVIDAMRVTEQFMGQTSANIAKASAAAIASKGILVLEEIDALSSIRTYASSADVENTRSTTSIMRVIEQDGPIVLTSNRLDVIDPAVIRRCEYIVEMPVPSPEQRRAIVARELGCDPGPMSISLSVAIPLARRARRVAILNDQTPQSVFATMIRRHDQPTTPEMQP